ncbi:MAG: hypothetical protein JWN88_2530 [Frankiales bacterium]|jgi:hypothetical protein|nr:hypothetical protein [Frankiales bacterium]
MDITTVLNLQGRARRNARTSMLRLQRERADAVEAVSAVTRARARSHRAAAPAPRWDAEPT